MRFSSNQLGWICTDVLEDAEALKQSSIVFLTGARRGDLVTSMDLVTFGVFILLEKSWLCYSLRFSATGVRVP